MYSDTIYYILKVLDFELTTVAMKTIIINAECPIKTRPFVSNKIAMATMPNLMDALKTSHKYI